MNPDPSTPSPPPAGQAERHSALFTGLVLQQANLAALFLGRAPHPDTGRREVNLEAASLFIDTLEALETRTRGNLSPDEAAVLADTLTDLRLAFVQAAEAAETSSRTPPAADAATPAAPQPASPAPSAAPAPETAAPADRREEEGGGGKRFVKRY